jgi:hypothetical protein
MSSYDVSYRELTSSESVIHNERDIIIVCEFGKSGDISDVVFRVSDRFDVECLGVVVD